MMCCVWNYVVIRKQINMMSMHQKEKCRKESIDNQYKNSTPGLKKVYSACHALVGMDSQQAVHTTPDILLSVHAYTTLHWWLCCQDHSHLRILINHCHSKPDLIEGEGSWPCSSPYSNLKRILHAAIETNQHPILIASKPALLNQQSLWYLLIHCRLPWLLNVKQIVK